MKVFATKRGHVHIAKIMLACLALGFFVNGQIAAQGTPEVSRIFMQASEAMRRGDLDAAGDGFFAAAKLAPVFAEAHFNLGLVRQEQGRLEEAIASFEKALKLKPRLHGANLFLAVAHYKLNHFDQALSAARKETSAYPEDASAWMWLGVIQLAKDRPEDATAALDKAANLAPSNVDILYHRGQAHLLVSKNSYAQMFKVDPKSWRVLQVLAQASSEADRPTEAIVEYQDAIKLAPTQPGLHEELGSAYRNAQRMDEAEAAFIRELEIAPHNALARYELGVLYMEKGDGTRARDLIQAALREKPDLLHGNYNLGRAEKLLGDDAAAAAHLEQAVANDSDPEIVQQAWYQLGMVYRRLHRLDEAQKAMVMFQKLQDAQAEESRQSLNKYKNKQSAQPSEPRPVPQDPESQ